MQCERTDHDVEGRIVERQPFTGSQHERETLLASRPSPRDREHLLAVIEAGRTHLDAAPAAVAHERVRDVGAAGADVENRPGAAATDLANDRRDAAEPAVRERDVGEISRQLRRRFDGPVHEFHHAGGTFHCAVSYPETGGGPASHGVSPQPMLIVLKYGGNAMVAGTDDPVLDEIAALASAGTQIVVVHGGGPQIDSALRERGIVEERIDGLRVTPAAARDVVEAVLCGSVNKDLVRGLLARGARAFGFSGQDGGILTARRLHVPGGDLGFVGVPVAVDGALLRAVLGLGVLPVIAPLGYDPVENVALNLNADTAAGAIAGALAADAYVVLTNVAGVRRDRDDPASVIPRLTTAQAHAFLSDGTFSDGMRPKMRAAIEAVTGGAARALIAAATRNGIRAALAGAGTELIA